MKMGGKGHEPALRTLDLAAGRGDEGVRPLPEAGAGARLRCGQVVLGRPGLQTVEGKRAEGGFREERSLPFRPELEPLAPCAVIAGRGSSEPGPSSNGEGRVRGRLVSSHSHTWAQASFPPGKPGERRPAGPWPLLSVQAACTGRAFALQAQAPAPSQSPRPPSARTCAVCGAGGASRAAAVGIGQGAGAFQSRARLRLWARGRSACNQGSRPTWKALA